MTNDPTPRDSSPAIAVKNAAKLYESTEALNDVSLCVPRGAVYGLLGRNGAGKSTLIQMLFGLLKPTSGEIRVLGLDPSREGIELRRRVGYIPEHLQMYGWMTVKQTLTFVAAQYPNWNRAVEERLIATFRVPGEKKIRDLSRGNVALLALVLAMAHDPEVVLLDECTSGMDAIARNEFDRSVIETLHETKRTILFASHQIRELERLCDWVGILKDGRMLLELPIDDLKASVKMLRIRPDESAPVPTFPGELQRQRAGREWLVTVRDHTPASGDSAKTGAVVETIDLDLEEIFIALLREEGEER
jgi:ABC-2 type transport system ATP-binding protein